MSKLDSSVFAEGGEERVKMTIDQISEELTSEVEASAATGSCHVSVWTINNCYNGHTLLSCVKLGASVGGVADFHQGQVCPN